MGLQGVAISPLAALQGVEAALLQLPGNLLDFAPKTNLDKIMAS